MLKAAPRVLLIYHFFHPDDVVSARLYSELAAGLRARGWDVTALTSNRSWADPHVRLPSRERWHGVTIERAYRPPWDQAKPLHRIANASWLLGAWLRRVATMRPFDAVVIGSDPTFAAAFVLPLRILWPDASLVHWCYDLYPEAILADGGGRGSRAAAAVAQSVMRQAYRRFDAIADLGPRMRERLHVYGGPTEHHTVTPWALVEPSGAPRPADAAVRRRLFGDAQVGLLYSGTLGRAHDYETFLELARACRARTGDSIVFCFACRGHRTDALRAAIRASDTNVRMASFCDERDLGGQLEAADVHLLSLRPAWSGLVVPSKFFGSLAVGRPVVYAGAPDSDIARWIDTLGLGCVVRTDRIQDAVEYLEGLAASRAALQAVQRLARRVYDEQFRRELGLEAWNALLRRLAGRPSNADISEATGLRSLGEA
jgi:hypothetical protein